MKRQGHLYEKVYAYDNLLLAHQNASKGKGWYEVKNLGVNRAMTIPENGIEITSDKVFVYANPVEVTVIDEVASETQEQTSHTEFEFELFEYEKDEYIQGLNSQMQETQDALAELAEMLMEVM